MTISKRISQPLYACWPGTKHVLPDMQKEYPSILSKPRHNHGVVVKSCAGLELREYGRASRLPLKSRLLETQKSYRICVRGHVIVTGLTDGETKDMYERMAKNWATYN